MSGSVGVAVTGLGVVTGLGLGLPAFSAALRGGRSCVGNDGGSTGSGVGGLPGEGCAATLPDLDLPAMLDAVGCLDGAGNDALRRRAVRTAGRAPLALRAAVAVAVEAWRQSGLDDQAVPPERRGLVVGGQNLTSRLAYEAYARFQQHPEYLPARFALRGLDTDHVGVVSAVLEVRGEGCTIGGASASGGLALVHGARLVASGEVDACIVLGAMADLSPMDLQSFRAIGALAPPDSEMCGPFDVRRAGFVYGQGAACLVLERAPVARARVAALWGVLTGWSALLDGNHLADPDEDGEVRAMTLALARAGLQGGQLDYVNAHGSGSPLGDRIEARALRRVLGGGEAWVNATKGLTGHCLWASGAVEAVATLVQIREGFVHANVGLEQPVEPRLRFAGREAKPAAISHALSNSFGFGGFNTSVVFAAA